MVQQYGDTATATQPVTATMQVPDDADATTTQRYEEARAAAHRAMSNVTIVPDQPSAHCRPSRTSTRTCCPTGASSSARRSSAG